MSETIYISSQKAVVQAPLALNVIATPTAAAETPVTDDLILLNSLNGFGSGRSSSILVPSEGDPVFTNTHPDVNFAKLQYGLAEIFVESQVAVQGLAGIERAGALNAFLTENSAVSAFGGHIVVEAIASDRDGAALLAQLEEIGLLSGASFGALVSGVIPIDLVDDISALGSLAFARPAYVATNVGAVTTEDVQALQADTINTTYGLTGAGVTVGVLSDSFDVNTSAVRDYADDVASGDLPSGINVLADLSAGAGSDEGRAMAQLIYDIAPGVDLAFHTAFLGQASFAQGILDLAAIAEIVVDDVFYLSEPFFQDGVIAQAIDQAAAGGTLYFSSSGNSEDNSYESAFVDSGQVFQDARLHDFDPGPGVDTKLNASQFANSTYVLQWDEPFASAGGAGAGSDVDFFIFDSTGNNLIAVANNNNLGADAIELLGLNGSGSFTFAVGVYTGADPGIFKIAGNGGFSFDEFQTNSPTSFGHTNTEGALSVGAAYYADTPAFGTNPPEAEDFTSTGGVPILFDTAGTRLASPILREGVDFTASNGGETTFFGNNRDGDADPFNFSGTSAAAPNAAAIAALLLEAFPGTTQAQIENAFESTAIDIVARRGGAPLAVGRDETTGAGFIDPVNAYLALVPSLMIPHPYDFDGDGGDDLLFHNQITTGAYVINGDGGFQHGFGQFPLGGIEAQGDLDGDGTQDIVVRFGDDAMRSYFGDASGVLAGYGTRTDQSLLALADFDGDGGDDLLFQRGSDGAVYVIDGDGGHQQGFGLQPSGGVEAVGDFDGNGTQDILVRLADGVVRSFNGGASGALTSYGGRTGQELIAVADFDGNGTDDLLLQRQSDGATVVVSGTGGFQFNFGLRPVGGIEGVGDVNGDGVLDIVVRLGNDALLAYDGNAPGVLVNYGLRTDQELLAVADFDGDGGDDLLLQLQTNGATFVLNGEGGFQQGFGQHPIGGIEMVGDFDGNGKHDILVRLATDVVISLGGDASGVQQSYGVRTDQALLADTDEWLNMVLLPGTFA